MDQDRPQFHRCFQSGSNLNAWIQVEGIQDQISTDAASYCIAQNVWIVHFLMKLLPMVVKERFRKICESDWELNLTLDFE